MKSLKIIKIWFITFLFCTSFRKSEIFWSKVCVTYPNGILIHLLSHCFVQFGRTEVIDNTLNPDFVRKFILDYFFEERQNLRFDL